jgi:hypothetical protein
MKDQGRVANFIWKGHKPGGASVLASRALFCAQNARIFDGFLMAIFGILQCECSNIKLAEGAFG